MKTKNCPATVQEALEMADRYPDAECWKRYRRQVLGTPEPFAPKFLERLSATVAEDPVALGRLCIHAIRAAQQREGGSND